MERRLVSGTGTDRLRAHNDKALLHTQALPQPNPGRYDRDDDTAIIASALPSITRSSRLSTITALLPTITLFYRSLDVVLLCPPFPERASSAEDAIRVQQRYNCCGQCPPQP